jgi:histidine triad (HIT) family protein
MKQQSSGQEGGGECLFCGIGKGNVETIKVYENNFVVAFLDITPAVPGQTIIIPKEHYQFIFQIPDMILWEMIRVMKMAMPIIVNATKCQGISVYIAQGPAAGQRIGHVAINLIPRFEGDKSAFMWERKEVAKEELDKIAKEIKLGIDKTVSEEKASIEKKVRREAQAKPATGKSEVPSPSEKLQEFPRRRG